MNRTTFRSRAGIWLPALIVLFVAACGGGGGPDSPSAPHLTTVAEVEYESFQLVNSARQEHNVRPQLDLGERVAQVARRHSEAMRDQGFFSHRGPNGGLNARLRAGGVQFSSAGENLAKLENVPNPAGQAHSLFLDSPEHRGVMLDKRFRVVGVGVARSGDTYWLTQIYIRP